MDYLHSAIRFVTPQQLHSGEDVAISKKRKVVYQMPKLANPCRWSGDTRNWNWIPKVSLNPDKFKGRKST